MVEPVRVLLLCYGDDQYHDHARLGAFLRGALVRRGFTVELAAGPEALEAGTLARSDALALYAVGANAPAAGIDCLLAAVNGERLNDRGRPLGFVGIHGATTCFQDNPSYAAMVGATFVSHPDMGPAYAFSVRDKAHPVTAGVPDFRLVDELYFFTVHSPFHTLVSCRHENIDRPVAWCKPHGQGRVFYIALGHGLEQLGDEHAQTLIANGIKWSVGESSHEERKIGYTD